MIFDKFLNGLPELRISVGFLGIGNKLFPAFYACRRFLFRFHVNHNSVLPNRIFKPLAFRRLFS